MNHHTKMPPTVDMRRHRLLLPLAFAFIAVLFAATQLVSWGKARAARQEAHKITSNMVTSIELIARMTRDIDTERFLIDEHILETDDAAQARIEALVAQAD